MDESLVRDQNDLAQQWTEQNSKLSELLADFKAGGSDDEKGAIRVGIRKTLAKLCLIEEQMGQKEDHEKMLEEIEEAARSSGC